MMRTILSPFYFMIAFVYCLSFDISATYAAEEAPPPPAQDWSFNGVFGTFDKSSAQRGLQVFTEVCSSCHSLRLIAYRNLTELGFSADEVKAYAKGFSLMDGPDDEGEMFERTAIPADYFVPPYPNEQAARAANNNAYPKDLSLAVKDHPYGADYIYALIATGYQIPEDQEINIGEGMYYNKWMGGNAIAMPAPLSDDLVEYTDGTKATVHQMAYDVTNFLAWAAEPEMEKRKQLGLRVMFVLMFMTVISFLVYRKVWRNVEH